MTRQRASLYADPAIYDILYTPGTAAEVDALERIERWWARRRRAHAATAGGRTESTDPAPDRFWFEPACGTGRYLRVAGRRGRRIGGYDRDEGLLAYARRRLQRTLPASDLSAPPPVVLATADMTDARVPGLRAGTVDFAFNPVNTLRLLPEDRAVLAHFQQMARLLKPGGLYVVGLSLIDYDWLLPEEDLWEAQRGVCRVSQLVNYLPPEPGTRRGRREQVVSHLTVTRPAGSDHFDDTYDLRCYDRRQWHRLLARSALQHVESFDAQGRPRAGRILPYQLEALIRQDHRS